MHFNSTRQPRKKLRLPGYDYRRPGYYFITICTNNRECLFGDIVNGEMRLNAAGQMISDVFYEIPLLYFGWSLDTMIVMPNHVHAILVLVDLDVGYEIGPAQGPVGRHGGTAPTITGPAQGPAPTIGLSELIRDTKSYTTACYSYQVNQDKWPAFNKRLWQRGYHDHIIRDMNNLDKIRAYILNNPAQWAIDQNNPGM